MHKTTLAFLPLLLWASTVYAVEESAPARFPLFSPPTLTGLGDRGILPSATMVTATGDRPVLVVSFKCPTELVGIAPPMVQAVHSLVDVVMNTVNDKKVLTFDMQQVCN